MGRKQTQEEWMRHVPLWKQPAAVQTLDTACERIQRLVKTTDDALMRGSLDKAGSKRTVVRRMKDAKERIKKILKTCDE